MGIANSPGMGLLGYGYDVFASPYCVEGERRGLEQDTGDQSVVPLLTGLDTNFKDEVVLGHTYRYPGLVSVLGEEHGTNYRDVYGRTIESYFQSMAVQANVGAAVGGFTGELETSYSEARSSYRDYVFGETSVVATGLSLGLPNPGVLRAHLKPEVHQRLLTDPHGAIGDFGTHLVGGVVVGGRSLLRNWSERTKVTDDVTWMTALKASYAGVTAGASISTELRSEIETFLGESQAQTIGGAQMLIATPADMQAWVQTVAQNPAISGFTNRLIPLWQLLDPNGEAEQRAALRDAVVRHARRYQAGALTGGYQDFTSTDSRAPSARNTSWGNSDLGEQSPLANGTAYSSQYGWGYSYTTVSRTTGAERQVQPDLISYAILGGEQHTSSMDGSQPVKVSNQWGLNPDAAQMVQDIVAIEGKAYTPDYGWGFSSIHLFLGQLEDHPEGFIVVGATQEANNNQSNAAWIPTGHWDDAAYNDAPYTSQPLGNLAAWSPQYGEGNSRLTLHLRPVLRTNDLAEVHEEPATTPTDT